jgi:hypothetical protein
MLRALLSVKKLLDAALIAAKNKTIQNKAHQTSGFMPFLKLKKLINTMLSTYNKILAKDVFCLNSKRNSFLSKAIMLVVFKICHKNS